MKKAFVKWLIEKVFKTEIVEVRIPGKIEYKHFLPKDGQWHHIAKTFEFWIKDGKVLEKVEDNYLDGIQIDEVRVWNNGRTKVQIKMYKNKELKGTEKDLKAYYKFEH